MEANECDNTHLESDALLPPRKRLLAGLKRQGSESSGSPESSSSGQHLNEYEARLQSLLKFYKDGSRMSPEEIAEAARSAASNAAKAAANARALAEEKAAAALKAVAAAKDAMSLVVSLSKGKRIVERENRKNKLKNHLQAENLYSNRDLNDEELARRLRGAFSSSPRVLASKCSKPDSVVEISGELVGSPDEIHGNGRKRGRSNQKELLPRSICSLKDSANPRDHELRESSSGDHSMSVEPAQAWKCQDFKVPQGIEPNKVMQS